jgi:hypothetical protein
MTTPPVSARNIADRIDALLAQRAPTASICPSEVARALDPTAWRTLMPSVRAVAAQRALDGAIRITQGNRTVDPRDVLTSRTRGPLRLRRQAKKASD